MKPKFTIVVADDDLDDQQLIRDALHDCKVEVRIIPVYDGIKLMDFLLKKQEFKNERDAPDLILLDLNMPLMDGFQSLKLIKSMHEVRDIPVYVITTSNSKREKEQALKIGALGFYTKGASSKEIRKIIAEICKECFEELQGEAAE